MYLIFLMYSLYLKLKDSFFFHAICHILLMILGLIAAWYAPMSFWTLFFMLWAFYIQEYRIWFCMKFKIWQRNEI